jgi:hypothetical protein
MSLSVSTFETHALSTGGDCPVPGPSVLLQRCEEEPRALAQ